MKDIDAISLAAALRQIALVVGGWAIGRGWLEEDTLTAIVTVIVIAVPFVWGQRKTRKLAKPAAD